LTEFDLIQQSPHTKTGTDFIRLFPSSSLRKFQVTNPKLYFFRAIK